MAREMRNQEGYRAGGDAAYVKPRLFPDDVLLPRDDSGGPDWNPYTAEFGDGGRITGDKKHLSVSGGGETEESEDEESKGARKRAKSD